MIFNSLRSILILFISLHSIKKTMALVNPYIQVNGLTRSVGDRVLFHDVSFGIAEGQHVGLIAQNGTGKTTLLNILAGKDSADEGSVIYRKDLRVGYLEQMPHYPMDMTVKEAAAMMRISLPKMYEFARSGKVRTLEFGRIILISRSSLLALLQEGE